MTRVHLISATAALSLTALVAFGPSAAAQTSGPPTTRPFASGMLASISGSTLQLQSAAGTATVVVTKHTRYQETKQGAVSDIAVGDCVRVAGTGSTTSGIQASTIAVTKPTTKGCTVANAFRSGRGRRPNGAFGQGDANGNGNGTRPPGAFNGGSRPANFAVAFGAVKSISGDTITVRAQTPAGPTSTTKPNSKPKVKTQTVTVTASGSPTVTETASATQQLLQLGSCVSADGTSDSLGTVTAQRVTVSQPQNGACPMFGFGGFGRFGPGGGGQNSATA